MRYLAIVLMLGCATSAHAAYVEYINVACSWDKGGTWTAADSFDTLAECKADARREYQEPDTRCPYPEVGCCYRTAIKCLPQSVHP